MNFYVCVAVLSVLTESFIYVNDLECNTNITYLVFFI